MGGRIWLEDPRVGEGATFGFALPAAVNADVVHLRLPGQTEADQNCDQVVIRGTL